MAARLSRPKRWAAAIAKAQGEISKIEAAQSEFNDALSDLRALQEEYAEWQSNLPEMAQDGPVNDKLEAIANLDLDDIEIDVQDLEDKINEAESAELPQGFGRD